MALNQLEEFLANTEKRAFRMARFAVANDADALDIVQDAMMKLVEKYAGKPHDQWAPLFYRILQNRILDFHRRNKTNQVISIDSQIDNENGPSMLEQADHGNQPQDWLNAEQISAVLIEAIENLPNQQQQCFLLRGWQGLSVRETAEAMNVTEGSIKTHYSRALAKLNTLVASADTPGQKHLDTGENLPIEDQKTWKAEQVL